MKAALIRLGIRGFKPELLKAPQRLEAQHTAEGVPIPPNMLDELRRDMARLAWVREQINAIAHFADGEQRFHAMVSRYFARS
jgi:transposase